MNSTDQQRYDMQQPPNSGGDGWYDYSYHDEDASPAQQIDFDVQVRGYDVLKVLVTRVLLWFGDHAVEVKTCPKERDWIHDWFDSQYENRKWFRAEVWKQINEQQRGEE
jgi:hypothetical protein